MLRWTGLTEASEAGAWGVEQEDVRHCPAGCSLAVCSLLTGGAIHIVDAALPFCSAAPSSAAHQVSPVKLSIREKARRALLRYTAAAIKVGSACCRGQHRLSCRAVHGPRHSVCQWARASCSAARRFKNRQCHSALAPPTVQDLRGDPDEMVRGVDWGKVARFVDLSDELPLFEVPSRSPDGAAGGGRSAEAGASAPQRVGLRAAGLQQDEQRRLAAGQHVAAAAGSATLQQGELFEAAGWAAPSFSAQGSARSRRAEALADLGWVQGGLIMIVCLLCPLPCISPMHCGPYEKHPSARHPPFARPRRRVSARPPLGHSSRRLLGASFATLSHKWEPRFSGAPGGASAGGPSAAGQLSDGEPSTAAAGGWSDLDAPLLTSSFSAASPRTPHTHRPSSSGGSGEGSGGEAGGGGGMLGGPSRLSMQSRGSGGNGPSRSASVGKRLDKWGSPEFADESPFWPAATSPTVRPCQALRCGAQL